MQLSVCAMNEQLQRSTRSSLATLCLHRNIHQGRRKGLLIQFVLCLLDHGSIWCYASTFKHLDRHGNIFVRSGPSVYYAGPYRGSKALATICRSPDLALSPVFTLHSTVPHGDLILCTKPADESKWGKCYFTLAKILKHLWQQRSSSCLVRLKYFN